jgi:hypothetical protein
VTIMDDGQSRAIATLERPVPRGEGGPVTVMWMERGHVEVGDPHDRWLRDVWKVQARGKRYALNCGTQVREHEHADGIRVECDRPVYWLQRGDTEDGEQLGEYERMEDALQFIEEDAK